MDVWVLPANAGLMDFLRRLNGEKMHILRRCLSKQVLDGFSVCMVLIFIVAGKCAQDV